MKHLNLNVAVTVFTFSFFLFCLANPSFCALYIRQSLKICSQSLIPALFPFVVLSNFFGKNCSFKNNIFTRFLSKIFGLSPFLSLTSFLGLFFGFPSGACAVSQAYKNNNCTKNQAELAIAFSNNCSCAFLINVVGSAIFGNVKIGYLFLISQILSVFTVSFILRKVYKVQTLTSHAYSQSNEKPITFQSFIKDLVSSIKDSAVTMIYICAFTVFFYLISGILCEFLPLFKSGLLKSVLCGFFEITSGVYSCFDLPFPLNIVICSALCSFAGISVYFQISSICQDAGLSCIPFLVSRFLCAPISALYTLILLLLFSYVPVSCFSFKNLISVTIVFAVIVIVYVFLHTKLSYWVEIHKKRH